MKRLYSMLLCLAATIITFNNTFTANLPAFTKNSSTGVLSRANNALNSALRNYNGTNTKELVEYAMNLSTHLSSENKELLHDRVYVDMDRVKNARDFANALSGLERLISGNPAQLRTGIAPILFLEKYDDFYQAGGVANLYASLIGDAIKSVDTSINRGKDSSADCRRKLAETEAELAKYKGFFTIIRNTMADTTVDNGSFFYGSKIEKKFPQVTADLGPDSNNYLVEREVIQLITGKQKSAADIAKDKNIQDLQAIYQQLQQARLDLGYKRIPNLDYPTTQKNIRDEIEENLDTFESDIKTKFKDLFEKSTLSTQEKDQLEKLCNTIGATYNDQNHQTSIESARHTLTSLKQKARELLDLVYPRQ